MRAHLLAALLAIMAAAVALEAITLELTARSELRKLEREQSIEEAKVFFGVLNSKKAALKNEVINYAWVDTLFEHVVLQNQSSAQWLAMAEDFHYQDLEALVLILPNGTQGSLPNESFPVASVLFCDIVGFKDWATSATPVSVAEFLGSFIDGLDEIVDRLGATKIKTILDLYKSTRHAHVLLGIALEFHLFSQGRSLEGHGIHLRIGVSSGPVAAGIIGKRNWIYDIWSDTVNMAARLKAKALPGTVLCDAKTCELASDEFEFEQPQTVELKGKGAQTVFALVRKKS
eukprot:m51a1_g10731 putative family 3 adenylate cyclase (288) ;mRNA; r:285951-290424